MITPWLLLTCLAGAPDGGAPAVVEERSPLETRARDAGVDEASRGASRRDAGTSAPLAADGGLAADAGRGETRDGGVRSASDGDAGFDLSGDVPQQDAGNVVDGLAFIEQAFVPRTSRVDEPPALVDAGPDPPSSGDTSAGKHDESGVPISVTLVLVLVFAFVVSRVLQRALGDRIVSSGIEYLFVGFLMGPHVLDLVGTEALSKLMPVVSLLLGFAGLLLGLRLRGRAGTWRTMLVGGLAATGTAAVIAVLFFFALPFVTDGLMSDRITLALTLGAASAAVSGTAIAGGAEFFRARGPLREHLDSAAQASNVVAVVVAGVTLGLGRALEGGVVLGPDATRFVGASIALGVGCGVLFRVFVGSAREGTTLFLATIALLTFASGMAAGLGVSPLLMNLVAGLVVSLLMKDATSLHEKLRPLERPALTTFAIFAGAMWQLDVLLFLALPVVYAAARRVVLPVATSVAQSLVPGAPLVERFAHGLFVQGGFAVAIAVNYAQVRPEAASIVLTTVLVALIVQDVLGIGTLRRLFGDEGELGTADVLASTLVEPSNHDAKDAGGPREAHGSGDADAEAR